MLAGGPEGRNPNPWFDVSFYLSADPTLRGPGENPLVHYLRVGASEERPTGPLFDTGAYLRSNPDVVTAGINPLVHFVIAGQFEARSALSGTLMPSAGDVDASIAAYQWMTTKASEARRSKLETLDVRVPPLIKVSDPLAQCAREIQLGYEASPLVSIVIPIVNGIRLTLESLLSIAEFRQDVPFEVVVVDNGSTDSRSSYFRQSRTSTT